ncbi:hypothetical protein [Nocardia sp. NPDC057353]|uniref:hypothetical protein n=1 Tax=Nocardia sp. NPDC057353 TaxID=3346104 RepID=UPI00363CEDB4
MKRFVVRFGMATMAVAAVGFGAGQAVAAPGLPLEPATVQPAEPVQGGFVPESGSAGPYNHAMCLLHTVSPQFPCMYS